MSRPNHQDKPRKHSPSVKRPPGLTPGTLIVDPDAPHPRIRLIAYGPDRFEEQEIRDVESVAAAVGQWPVAWVNVDGLGNAEVIHNLGAAFGLHHLALEDVVNVPQRSKVEQYGDVVYIVARMASLGEEVETEQLSLFLGKDFVLTFEERPGDCLDPVRQRIREGLGLLRSHGPDYLAYAILDAIIDAYFPILEQYSERLEDLEEAIIAQPSRQLVSRVHDVKRDLLTLRRAIWPLREAINSLVRDPMPLITQETRIHLRDCYDHVVQIIELVETNRELGSDLTDLYLSMTSNRMNEVMQVLTMFASIFIPLSFIAGVYGMNFNAERSPLNMPELNWFWGYPFALGLMAAVAGSLLVFFWRKGWLGPTLSDEEGPGSRRRGEGDEE